MLLKYRVSLQGIKGFARVYVLESDTTLYDFHKILRDELDFAHDQLIQFKALNEGGGLVARYAMFDLGWGTMDAVSLGDTVAKKVASFQYFYDVTNRKSVIVTCEGEVEPDPKLTYPALIETKGPNPIEFENGYVAYEDLSDEQKHIHTVPGWGKDKLVGDDDEDLDDDDEDFDDDEEDEDPDDEDGKEIYDANE